jgi:hypothetical protein
VKRWKSPAAQRRDRLGSGLIRPACTGCPAVPGEWCDPLYPPPSELIRFDREPLHVVHTTRAVAAIEAGHVKRAVLAAQFAGGPLPAALTPQ